MMRDAIDGGAAAAISTLARPPPPRPRRARGGDASRAVVASSGGGAAAAAQHQQCGPHCNIVMLHGGRNAQPETQAHQLLQPYGTNEARYLARITGSQYPELRKETELLDKIKSNVAQIKAVFTQAVQNSGLDRSDEAVDALFATLCTVGRGETDRTTAQEAFRGSMKGPDHAEVDQVLALHLHSRSLVNRYFASHGGWPVKSVFFSSSDSGHALQMLRVLLPTGAHFEDIKPELPLAVQKELEESAATYGHTILSNRLEEDTVLSINHQGEFESKIVGTPPMFELILSQTPKLTLETIVLKTNASVQARTGVPFELLQIVVFAFCHEIYPALAKLPSCRPPSGANWLDFLGTASELEQVKISRTSVVNELFKWWRPWSQQVDSEGEWGSAEKQQLLWGIPNVSNSLRFLGILNLALDLRAALVDASSDTIQLPPDSEEFYFPMGVYEPIQRKSQAMKAEKVQLGAGDGFINMTLRRRPKSRKRLFWQTWVGYGTQATLAEKCAHQEAFDRIEGGMVRLLAELADFGFARADEADEIYGVLLEEIQQAGCTGSKQTARESVATALQAKYSSQPKEIQMLVRQFIGDIGVSVSHFAQCKALAGLKILLGSINPQEAT
eukprot:COSAG01_NODE_5747_length_4061_cov_13.898536_1_plen_616_part_00